MAYLNQTERENLQRELRGMKFNKARARIRRLDPKVRLAYIRNVQNVGEWATRYDLEGIGTRVTLIENYQPHPKGARVKADFELVDVIVEPLPHNRT